MVLDNTTERGDVLVERLFSTGQARWGWEYVEPSPAQPSVEANRPPQWQEPAPADTRAISASYAKARRKLVRNVVFVGFLLFAGILSLTDGGVVVLLLALVLGYFWFAPILLASRRSATAQQRVADERAVLLAAHERELVAWHQRLEAHNAEERRRIEAERVWYPLQLESNPSRVDVFGGTPAGWASLVGTAGSALLSAGSSVLVLDFSEGDVGGGLAALADRGGLGAQRYELPQDLPRAQLLEALEPGDLAEVLAAAANTGRDASGKAETRALSADLFATVAERLDAPLTFARLRAGLQVLRRAYESGEGGPLSLEEEARITRQVDLVGQTDRVQDELRFLVSMIDLLAREEPTFSAPREPAPAGRPALTIMATSTRNERRKQFADSLVFNCALHHLRSDTDLITADVVVLAGAERFGTEALESFALHARRRRIRVVFLLEHMRGELQEFLGGTGSAALLMQMANPKAADLAAQFVGKGHKFVLSQVTRSVGETLSQGGGTSEGESDGTSYTQGKSSGASLGPGGDGFSSSHNWGTSRSTTESRTRTWQSTQNWSQGTSSNEGTTDARVYEYTVEPAVLQSLPETAFVLVEAGSEGRRVRFGDCNPGIVTLERVADAPRRALGA